MTSTPCIHSHWVGHSKFPAVLARAKQGVLGSDFSVRIFGGEISQGRKEASGNPEFGRRDGRELTLPGRGQEFLPNNFSLGLGIAEFLPFFV